MERPILFLMSEAPSVLEALETDLSRRFANDCVIHREESPTVGLSVLEELSVGSEPVALIVADQRMEEMTGVDFLGRAHEIVPEAKRIL
jgi:thioredoxin reductase (NADPH)